MFTRVTPIGYDRPEMSETSPGAYRAIGRAAEYAKSCVLARALSGLGPLGHTESDEPIFVLTARDILAADTIRYWATLLESQQGGLETFKVKQAREIAMAFDRWRHAHGGGNLPD